MAASIVCCSAQDTTEQVDAQIISLALLQQTEQLLATLELPILNHNQGNIAIERATTEQLHADANSSLRRSITALTERGLEAITRGCRIKTAGVVLQSRVA